MFSFQPDPRPVRLHPLQQALHRTDPEDRPPGRLPTAQEPQFEPGQPDPPRQTRKLLVFN